MLICPGPARSKTPRQLDFSSNLQPHLPPIDPHSSPAMASKLFSVPRVGRQLVHQLPKPQYRAFSAGSQRFSDLLSVVRIPFDPSRASDADCVLGLAQSKTHILTAIASNSTATRSTTTRASRSSFPSRTSNSPTRSSSAILPSTRRLLSCPCLTSVSASTASPASVS